MALDPRILLQGRSPDLLGAIQSGLSVGEQIRQQPMRDALLKAQVDQAQAGLLDDSGTRVGARKIFNDGTILQSTPQGPRVFSPAGVLLSGQNAEAQLKTAFNNEIALVGGKRRAGLEAEQDLRPGIEGDIATSKGEAEIPVAAKKQLQKQNISRISELSSGSKSRSASIEKAGQFLRALKSGRAHSGAGRQASQFIPGVFTSQGVFDEKFNAFAEVAARQQLKAAGETRPTDADVEGMKRAMFGVARDETTNIQLLTDYIEEQGNLDDELMELDSARKSGNLGTFSVGTQGAAETDQPAFDESLLEFMTPEERALFSGS